MFDKFFSCPAKKPIRSHAKDHLKRVPTKLGRTRGGSQPWQNSNRAAYHKQHLVLLLVFLFNDQPRASLQKRHEATKAS